MKRIQIKENYKKFLMPFDKKPEMSYEPLVPVILKSTRNGIETKFSKKFIIDTGASISIINSIYQPFLDNCDVIDHLEIQYGVGKKRKLPIYELIFLIKGNEIKSIAGFDDQASYLLLGRHNFLDKFNYNLFDYTLKKSKLIKT